MRCTDLLIQDHRIILRSLNVLEQLAVRVDQGDQPADQDVITLLRFLRGFADEHHQTKEESALFPELLRNYASPEAPVRQMLFEHDQERSLVEGLEDSLYTKRGRDFVHFASRLAALVRNHIHKEDNVLFEIVALSFSAKQDKDVVAALDKFQINPAFLVDLQRLEWKYLGKAADLNRKHAAKF